MKLKDAATAERLSHLGSVSSTLPTVIKIAGLGRNTSSELLESLISQRERRSAEPLQDEIEWHEFSAPSPYRRRTFELRKRDVDPKIDQQWHLNAVNLGPAVQAGLTGRNVKLRVNDDGIFTNLDDLVVNVNTSFNYVTRETDPTPPAVSECFEESEGFCAHGTFCAALAAAQRNNGICGAGIAPGVLLSGAAVIGYSDRTTTGDVADALSANIDIASNSWGLSGCESRPNPFDSSASAIDFCILARIPRSTILSLYLSKMIFSVCFLILNL